MPAHPVTYGYARVSKADDDAKNLETQLRLLANHGIREDLIFTDVARGRTMNRPGWRSPEQVEQCRRMGEEGAGLRQIDRVLKCSPATVKGGAIHSTARSPIMTTVTWLPSDL